MPDDSSLTIAQPGFDRLSRYALATFARWSNFVDEWVWADASEALGEFPALASLDEKKPMVLLKFGSCLIQGLAF